MYSKTNQTSGGRYGGFRGYDGDSKFGGVSGQVEHNVDEEREREEDE